MRINNICQLLLGIAILTTGILGCRTSQISESISQATNVSSVHTKFITDGKLSDSEVLQIVTLAEQCGIKEVAEVETFYFLPSIGKGISVRSKERIDGRNHSYEELVIGKKIWKSREPTTNAIQHGDFWADPSELYTRHLREYEFKNNIVLIQIGRSVDVAIADKAIPLIFAKKFPAEIPQMEEGKIVERLFRYDPDGIYRLENGDYELHFKVSEGMWETFQFKIEEDKIRIIGIGHIVV